MNKSIELYIDWKKKTVSMTQPQNIQLKEEEGHVIIIGEMLKTKSKELIDMFEDEIISILTVEQEISLYKYWGDKANRTVMLSRTASAMKCDKNLARTVIQLAERHGLLASGWNSTWKVKLEIVKERWIDKAKEKEYYLKNLDIINKVSLTPEESLEKLNKLSTSKQKAIARGEEGMIVKENMIIKENMTVKVKNDIVRNSLAKHDIIEPGIEIISQDENKLYSPAAQAKAKEHMQWKKDTEDTKKKTLHAMNHLHHTSSSLPLSVKILSTPVTRKRP